MGRNFEKSYDDLVYEDNFYEDNYNKDIKSEEDAKEENTETQEVMCICEECDKQWEEVIDPTAKDKIFCPMCGSNKITQM